MWVSALQMPVLRVLFIIHKLTLRFSILLLLFYLWGCGSKNPENEPLVENESYNLQLPFGFPPPEINEDNPLTQARVNLGKSLFFDVSLSRDSSMSCAGCHKPGQAFADNQAVSPGVQERLGLRNSPSLLNVAYLKNLLADGGVNSLELQAITPITDHMEMDFDLDSISLRLRETNYYKEWSEKAYHRELDSYVITHALASFQRTLYSGNSLYDKFIQSGDSSLFSEDALEGLKLFESDKTNCSKCHSGFLFTDQLFHNIGLLDSEDDRGRERITLKSHDRNKFKTPSLRNVAITGPYMHNGSIKELDEVIEFFNTGGEQAENKSVLIKPLNLNEIEKNQLLAFLETLTDEQYLKSKH